MRKHDLMDTDALEKAALYALGCMDPADLRAYEAELAGDAAAQREVTSLARTARRLVLAADVAEPPADLGRRVMDAVDATTQEAAPTPIAQLSGRARCPSPGDLFIKSSDDGIWEPTQIDGIEMKRLFGDPQNDRMTILVRMAAGTAYPSHLHAGDEECYVISGDLQVGGEMMRAGDYQFAAAGTAHVAQSTLHGCELLITCSTRDALL